MMPVLDAFDENTMSQLDTAKRKWNVLYAVIRVNIGAARMLLLLCLKLGI